MKRIYLDAAAATPEDRRVRIAMTTARRLFGNPSGIHEEGVAAKRLLEEGRRRTARFLSARPGEVIFTSGGTEGNNLALQGTARGHLITAASEHPSVLEPVRVLERRGLKVSFLPVDKNGFVDSRQLAAALRPETTVVSIGLVNSETGVVQPFARLSKVVRDWRRRRQSRFPYFHTDACQAPRFLELNVLKLGVDLLTLDGSKIYGPRGAGALFVKSNCQLEPVLFGGGQEDGRRAGTENVVGAWGLAAALEICGQEWRRESRRLALFRARLASGLTALGGMVNGSPTGFVPGILNVAFPGVEAEQLVIELDARGIAVSTGVACRSGDASHVIMAMGRDERIARQAVRFSLGRETTGRDIACVLRVMPGLLKKLRKQI